MMPLNIKILGWKAPQRYAVRRAVLAALANLQEEWPGLQAEVSEIRESARIEQYTSVTIYPSLVINEELVCVGRFPKKEEIVGWLRKALDPAA